MSNYKFSRSPIYYSSTLLYDKRIRYSGGYYTPIGNIYEIRAYKPRDKRKSRLSKTIYTREEYRCMVYADNEYEAYITMLDFGYEDIVIINP